MRAWVGVLLAVTVVGGPAAALAQGSSVCAGSPTASSSELRGPILEVPDSESLCVALSDNPSTWVRVVLAQPAPTRGALMAAAFGKNAVCTVRADGRGVCKVESAPLGDLLRRSEIIKTSADWR